MQHPNHVPHVERAIAIFGSQAALAEKIGRSQQFISWLLRASTITAETAALLDRATNGAVSKYTLRPDVFGPAPESKSEDAA